MQPQGNALANLIPILLVMVIFYFMLIRPQQQEQKKRQEMISKLAKNDEVITASGIHGTIVSVKDKTVILRVDDNVKIELEKSAVGEVVRKAA